MDPISGINVEQAIPNVLAPSGQTNQSQNSFKDVLLESIRQVNSAQQQADQAVENLFTGGDANPAEVLTAVQKADLTFRMMMQIRNKLLDAYEEINRLRV